MKLEPPMLSAELKNELLIRIRSSGALEKVSLPQLSLIEARPRFWGDTDATVAVQARLYVPEEKLTRVETAVKRALGSSHPLNQVQWRLQSPPRPYDLG